MTLVVEVSKVHNAVVTVDFFHTYFSFASVMYEWCTYITSTPQSPMLCTYEHMNITCWVYLIPLICLRVGTDHWTNGFSTVKVDTRYVAMFLQITYLPTVCWPMKLQNQWLDGLVALNERLGLSLSFVWLVWEFLFVGLTWFRTVSPYVALASLELAR